jgi:hypothetical protein
VPPGQQPGAAQAGKTALVVEIDNRVRIPRLQIPKSLLKDAGAGEQGAQAPAPEQPQQEAAVAEGPRRLPTVMAGTALALGFMSGGLWLLRRPRRRLTVTLLLVAGLLAVGGTALWANAAPPLRQRPPQPVPVQPLPAVRPQLVLPAGILLPGNIDVEVVEKGDAIRLIVNRNMVLRAAGVRPAGVPARAIPPGGE